MVSFGKKALAAAAIAGSLVLASGPSASADTSPQAACTAGLGTPTANASYSGYAQYLVVNSTTINNVSYSLSTSSQGVNPNSSNNNFQAYLLDGGAEKGWYESKSGHTLDDLWGPTLGTGVQSKRGTTKLIVTAWFLGAHNCKGISFAY